MIKFLEGIDVLKFKEDSSFEVITQLYYPAEKYFDQNKRIIDYTDSFNKAMADLRCCTLRSVLSKTSKQPTLEEIYKEALLLINIEASNINDKTIFSGKDLEFIWPVEINSRFYLLKLSGGMWKLWSHEKRSIAQKFTDVESLFQFFKLKSPIMLELSTAFTQIENKKSLKQKVSSL